MVFVCLFVTDIRGLRPGQWDERALCTSVHPSSFFSFLVSVCLFVHLLVLPSIRPSIILSIRSSVLPSICPSVLLSIRPSVRQSFCPSVHQSFHPSVHPFVSPSVHLSLTSPSSFTPFSILLIYIFLVSFSSKFCNPPDDNLPILCLCNKKLRIFFWGALKIIIKTENTFFKKCF